MRHPRGPLPPGPVALFLVAVVAVPEVIRHCKPLARSIGDILVKAGNEIHRMVEKDDQQPKSENSAP